MSRSTPAPVHGIALAAICSALFLNTASAFEVGPSLLPSNSTGLIQLRVDAIQQSNSRSVVWQLIDHVEEELGAFSVRHLGLDATQLSEVTLLLPPATYLQQSQEAPFVVAFTFRNNFSQDDVLRRLPEGWGSAVSGQARYFTNPNSQAALTFAGSRTIVVGAPSMLTKWISAPRGNLGQELVGRFGRQFDQSHIYGVFDASQVPAELRSGLPTNLASLEQAQAVGFSASIQNNQLDLSVNLAFNGRSHAGSARRALQSLVKQGAAALTFVEAEFASGADNANASLEEGVQSLAGLALVRYGQQQLNQLQIDQNDHTLTARTQVDASLLVFSLAALGNSQQLAEVQSRSKFESVSDQLNTIK